MLAKTTEQQRLTCVSTASRHVCCLHCLVHGCCSHVYLHTAVAAACRSATSCWPLVLPALRQWCCWTRRHAARWVSEVLVAGVVSRHQFSQHVASVRLLEKARDRVRIATDSTVRDM
jgi:hypothetical protein